jgi:uncharacterized membrane protein
MAKIKFLLAGESWVSNSTHFKGWDFFSSTVYETGVEYLEMALEDTDIDFIHMPSHQAALSFPLDLEELKAFDVICLSDIGANTLLLHPDTWLKGISTPNRLKLLAEWVHDGGGLLMCGGYYSFAGIYGAAKYYRSPLEPVLPVSIHPFDDRVETPEGVKPNIVMSDHPVVQGLGTDWPQLLGFNELVVRPEADLIAKVDEHPLLASMEIGRGRSIVWASDIGPHWCPTDFARWRGYAKLWANVIHWLTKRK